MPENNPFELYASYLDVKPGSNIFIIEGGDHNPNKRHEFEDGRLAVVEEDPTQQIKSANVLLWYGLSAQKLHTIVLLLDNGDLLTRELHWDPEHPQHMQKAKPAHTAKICVPDVFTSEDKAREYVKAVQEGYRFVSGLGEDVSEYFIQETILTLPEILTKMAEELSHTQCRFLNAEDNRDKRLVLDLTGEGHQDVIYDDMVIEVRNEIAERLMRTAEQYEQLIEKEHGRKFGKKG